jgi:hypothetical protein
MLLLARVVQVLPLPSWPSQLSPQHITAPLLVSAQAWLPPAAIAVTPLAMPATSIGALPPSLTPQHLTAPLLVRAQVCWEPAEIALIPLPRPKTSTGTVLAVFVPSPSWPL